LGIRIIAPDRPGFGLSDFQENRTLLDWPDDVLVLADHLGIKRFAIIGVSGGGPYAAVCAYRIPKNRLTRVGIAVGVSPTKAIEEIFLGMSLMARLAWSSYHRFPFLISLASSILWLQAKKVIPTNVFFMFRAKADRALLANPDVKLLILRNQKEAFRQGHRGAARDLRLYTTDWHFNLNDIRTPVFLWYGEDDKNVSLAMGKYYAAHIPGSKLTVYPGEGHLAPVTHVAEILRVLAG
jgi:pimeloyl-ACP methyl ester carboxylesterase